MIDYIRGQVASKSPTRLILEVGGIGFLLHIPLSTCERIPNQGEVTVLTQLFVRDDQLKIFGFATEEERNLFQLLLSVNGIGPNTAISILSGSTVDDIKHAVVTENARALEKIKGIGKKTAERIILELKETIKQTAAALSAGMDIQQRALISDAVMALVSLGYGRAIAEKAVNEAMKKIKTIDNIEELVRESLKYKT
ncbi:MAG: Holliday junction branch migration protein RuvA [Candidatus Brocadiaceae bacterium]